MLFSAGVQSRHVSSRPRSLPVHAARAPFFGAFVGLSTLSDAFCYDDLSGWSSSGKFFFLCSVRTAAVLERTGGLLFYLVELIGSANSSKNESFLAFFFDFQFD